MTFYRHRLRPLLGSLVLLPILACANLAGAASSAIEVENAKVREVPPGAPASAAFMTLQNRSSDAVRLIKATSSISRHTELHHHTQVEGVMQMRQVEAIEIGAEDSTVLAPGGLHLMLIGLEASPVTGQDVSLTLTFDNGDTLNLEAPVQPIMPMQRE